MGSDVTVSFGTDFKSKHSIMTDGTVSAGMLSEADSHFSTEGFQPGARGDIFYAGRRTAFSIRSEGPEGLLAAKSPTKKSPEKTERRNSTEKRSSTGASRSSRDALTVERTKEKAKEIVAAAANSPSASSANSPSASSAAST